MVAKDPTNIGYVLAALSSLYVCLLAKRKTNIWFEKKDFILGFMAFYG